MLSMKPIRGLGAALSLALMACAPIPDAPQPTATDLPRAAASHAIRVATFNLGDISSGDLLLPEHPRLIAIAERLQRVRPDIILLNEVAHDGPGSLGFDAEQGAGANGRRLIHHFLARSQGPGLDPLDFQVYTAPSNTGISSGHDLDHRGGVVDAFPTPVESGPGGKAPAQRPEGRAYGGDCWGFGTYPGQYSMLLLVRSDLKIIDTEARTFRTLPWSSMPGALEPVDPATGNPWYGPEEWAEFPFSSKSHWDIPIRLSGGPILHILASHPTPPAFDGPEARNRKRNHDEIRFWSDYLSDPAEGSERYIVDDQGREGGLSQEEHFVILGDLNADPDEGSSWDNPIGNLLLAHPRIQADAAPVASAEGVAAFPKLDPDDTARWGLRVDYVLPSTGLRVLGGAVHRPTDPSARQVSDHFLVWLDLEIPHP